MIELTYLRLSEVELGLSCSRDTLTRCAAVGLLNLHGEKKGRRVVAATYYALKARIEAGEDLWQLLRDAETASAAVPSPSEVSATAKAQSTKTPKASGGTPRRRKKASASPESERKAKPGPSWLKLIT